MVNPYMNMLAELEVKSAHPGGELLTKQMLSNLKITPEMTVLDAGCGVGETSRLLNDLFGCQIKAIDNHPTMIKKAQTKLEGVDNISIQLASLLQLPFKEDTFHYVLCESVLSFIPAYQALQEINRVLKKTSRLFFNEMCLIRPLPKKVETQIMTFYGVEQIRTKENWFKLLTDIGFTDITELSCKPSKGQTTEVVIPATISEHNLEIIDRHVQMLHVMADYVESIAISCEK